MKELSSRSSSVLLSHSRSAWSLAVGGSCHVSIASGSCHVHRELGPELELPASSAHHDGHP